MRYFYANAYFMKDNTAIVLSNGMLHNNHAKTAHGLIRGTDRYRINAVIDHNHAGQDAGEVLDGIKRNIPIYANVEEALLKLPEKPAYCIIGVATSGGVLPPEMLESVTSALDAGISIVNGLHEQLSGKETIRKLANERGAKLIDIRRPRNREELHFWTGAIYKVSSSIVAVLGMDCATGKRTTARLLAEACREEGLVAEMIYTGQTGWMQGSKYGFIFDSTLNDFISGEIEHAIVSCFNETSAEFIFIEGQSSLRNPAGPCGSEFLISGNAKQVVLVFNPKQEYFDDDPAWGRLPSVESEIKLIESYGSKVMALSLNTHNCSPDEAKQFQQKFEQEFKLPVLLPVMEGVRNFIPHLKSLRHS